MTTKTMVKVISGRYWVDESITVGGEVYPPGFWLTVKNGEATLSVPSDHPGIDRVLYEETITLHPVVDTDEPEHLNYFAAVYGSGVGVTAEDVMFVGIPAQEVLAECYAGGHRLAVIVTDEEAKQAAEAVWVEDMSLPLCGYWDTDFSYPSLGVTVDEVAGEMDYAAVEKAGYTIID